MRGTTKTHLFALHEKVRFYVYGRATKWKVSQKSIIALNHFLESKLFLITLVQYTENFG